MAKTTAGLKAAERSFTPRPDGGWNYFPKGFGMPGYRVDDETRQRLLSNQRMLSRQGGLIVGGSLAVAYFGGNTLAASFPVLAPFMASWIIRWGIAIPLMAAAVALLTRIYGRECDRLLLGAPQLDAAMSPHEARAKALAEGRATALETYRQFSLMRRVISSVVVVVLLGYMTYAAYRRFQLHTSVSIVEAILLSVFAASVGLGWAAMHRWMARSARLPRPE